MNEKKTGAFIASLRKDRALTQKQLAEKLNVTDKAVSKWETGKGYPDIDSLMALSKYFGVSVNELLVGERLSNEKKQKEAQKNIASELIDEKKRRQRLRLVAIAVALLTVMFLITQIFGIQNTVGNITDYFQQDSVCYISEDYGSLEICGIKYKRVAKLVDFVDFIWVEDKVLCDRPMVGDILSHEDKIYSVKFCDNYDYVCLKQDSMYVNAVYCKVEKYDAYLKSSEDDRKVYCLRTDSGFTELSDSFTKAIDSLTEEDCYNGWSPEDTFCDIYSRCENSPLLYFYAYVGEENGRYFITFSGGDINHSKDITYGLNKSASEELGYLIQTEKER